MLFRSVLAMPNNKSPGVDGFPAEFYKHFWPTISPLVVKMVNVIKRTSSIPSQRNTALILVLLKPNKDSTLCSSYRPISLINTDLKIISKALSTKLEKVISNLIHPDQTGFIKGRQSSHNTRRLRVCTVWSTLHCTVLCNTLPSVLNCTVLP